WSCLVTSSSPAFSASASSPATPWRVASVTGSWRASCRDVMRVNHAACGAGTVAAGRCAWRVVGNRGWVRLDGGPVGGQPGGERSRAGEAVTRYNIAMRLRAAGRLREAVAELEIVVVLDRAVQHPDLDADTAMLHQVRAEAAGPPGTTS